MVAGYSWNNQGGGDTQNAVDVLSTDPEKYPVLACARLPASFPINTHGAVGGNTKGSDLPHTVTSYVKQLFSCADQAAALSHYVLF